MHILVGYLTWWHDTMKKTKLSLKDITITSKAYGKGVLEKKLYHRLKPLFDLQDVRRKKSTPTNSERLDM